MGEKKENKFFENPEFQAAMAQFIYAYILVAQAEGKNYNDDGFTFIKSDVETPEGGLYLMQLVHVKGPKIQMRDPECIQQDNTQQNNQKRNP